MCASLKIAIGFVKCAENLQFSSCCAIIISVLLPNQNIFLQRYWLEEFSFLGSSAKFFFQKRSSVSGCLFPGHRQVFVKRSSLHISITSSSISEKRVEFWYWFFIFGKWNHFKCCKIWGKQRSRRTRFILVLRVIIKFYFVVNSFCVIMENNSVNRPIVSCSKGEEIIDFFWMFIFYVYYIFRLLHGQIE